MNSSNSADQRMDIAELLLQVDGSSASEAFGSCRKSDKGLALGLHRLKQLLIEAQQRAIRRSEDHGRSTEEPQKNRREYEGNLRQCDEEVSYHGITIMLTMTPEAHDGHRDESTSAPWIVESYTARAHLKAVHN